MLMKKARTETLTVFLVALFLIPAFAWGEEPISVPLSNPSEPALIHVSLVMGSIEVEGYDGNEVLIESKTDMEMVERTNERRRDGLRMIPNTSSGMSVEEEDNEVEISVQSWNRAVVLSIKTPRRSSLKLSTVNDGDIVVRNVEGEIEIGNTNGSIEAIGISGSVVAQTINGEIVVKFDSITAGKAMSFTNMNGDIDVTFPGSIKADLRMRSDMGDILTDFDFETVAQTRREADSGKGRGFRLKIEKEIHGKVNGGGPEMVFKNFNGDILIRKAK